MDLRHFDKFWIYISAMKTEINPIIQRTPSSTLMAKVKGLKPVLTLLYLCFMGLLCIIASQKYLGVRLDPMMGLTFMCIIFGVYTLNRFTDTAEDFSNDLSRLLFFQKQGVFLFLTGASLVGSFGFLFLTGKLNWMHLLLLGMGWCYSYRLIPWYDQEAGFQLLRIKEMTFVKNLSVSFLWSASVFILPILYSAPKHYHLGMIWMLAIGLFLSTLNNTLFDDILDEEGDRVAGIKTLPTVWGAAKSQWLLVSLNIVWITAIMGFYFAGKLDRLHATFLSFMALYPFLYMGLNLQQKLSKGWIDFLSESDLLLFSIGLLLLSLV